MNIDEFVALKQHEIKEIERTDMLRAQMKDALTKKFRAMIIKVDEKLCKIDAATTKLNISHLVFKIPYKDKYGGDYYVNESGEMYTSTNGGGLFFFHTPRKVTDTTTLMRMENLLTDTNCPEKIEQAFIESANSYINKKKADSNEKYKEVFDALSCTKTSNATKASNKWLLNYVAYDESGNRELGHMVFDDRDEAEIFVINNLLLQRYYALGTTVTTNDDTIVIKTANHDEYRITKL